MRLALFAVVMAAGCLSSSRDRASPRTDGSTPPPDAGREAAAADARLDRDLRVVGTPLLEIAPSSPSVGFTTEATAAGGWW